MLEKATISTIESGKMTKDLAAITSLEDVVVLNTEQFIQAVKKKYEETYASGAYQQQQDKIRDSEMASHQQEEVEADALLEQI